MAPGATREKKEKAKLEQFPLHPPPHFPDLKRQRVM